MMSSGAKPACCGQQVVGAAADRHLPLDRVGLALLVEGHHHDAGAVAADPPGLRQEVLLALLQADRVDHALALHALQPGLEHAPPRAVDHDRDPGDLGLGGDVVEERGHRLLAVEQVGVHVDVQQVRPAADLLERHVRRRPGVVAGLDQPAEPRRAGHVRPLADHHEAGVRPDLERLQAAEPGAGAAPREPRGAAARRRRAAICSMCAGRGAAAAADDVDHACLGEPRSSAAVSCGCSS